jgi:putative ABC transport system substrate-binding protein
MPALQAGARMKRRQFFGFVGAMAAWHVATHAQPARLPTIGFLGPSTAATAVDRITAFEQRLTELGWAPGQKLIVRYEWADGKADKFKEIAADFVRQRVDVIATWGTATALAVKQATSTIPIVFTIVSDPVGTGLVNSLARPGGNVTGLSTEQADIAGKRLEIIREVLPNLDQLAILANAANPGTQREMHEAQIAARSVGLQTVDLQVRGVGDLQPAIEMARQKAQALFVTSDAFLGENRVLINKLALDARLPTVYGFRGPVQANGLISYGPSYTDLFRRAADYVDRILRGTTPAELPVEQPTKFELIINLKTARVLGITVPSSLLARAEEVIE